MANPSAVNPNPFQMLGAPCPALVSLTAKYGPKIKGSQEIPTTAMPPPGAALNNRGDQCASSPANRNKVIPRVIKAGTRIKPRISREESEVDSGI
jgi:hypothetical protein